MNLRCSCCKNEIAGFEVINCMHCNAFICRNCAENNAMLCPYCTSELFYNN